MNVVVAFDIQVIEYFNGGIVRFGGKRLLLYRLIKKTAYCNT